jgi:hypothetical protein
MQSKTRELIINTGLRHFVRLGYDQTSLEQLDPHIPLDGVCQQLIQRYVSKKLT